ncbi:MAG: hypothetical protein AAF657_39465, partial [Acidobacteriota bacterium]
LSVLAYPLYRLFGYHGLLLLNALSFLAINGLIFVLGRTLFDSRRIGGLGVLVYSLATFAWEYSHTSYPHLSSTLFIVAAYTLIALAFRARQDGGTHRRTILLSAGAGLVAGLAVGLRLDAVFAIPGLFVPLLFAKTILFAELAALLAGLVPGFVFLSLSNAIKFGTYSPFSYGAPGEGYVGNLHVYLPISLAGAAGVGLLLLWQRLPAEKRPILWKLGAAGGVLAVLVFHGAAWEFASRLAHGTYQIVVDLRIRDLHIKEPALSRTPSGTMVYLGSVKKSLLQSCPYLAILPFLLIDTVRSRRKLRALAFLAVAPACYVLYYSYLAWHGSIALNMRYLNPVLPFTSLLCAYAWHRLTESGSADRVSQRLAGFYGLAVLVGLLVVFVLTRPELPLQEMLFLDAPLILAAGIVALEAMRRLGWLPSLGRPAIAFLLLTAAAWSGAMALRDYPLSAAYRGANLYQADALRPHIEDHSLIVSDVVDSCWKLIDEVDDLLIASAAGGSARSLNGLIRFHLDQGRKVYLAYSPWRLQQHLAGGLSTYFDLRQIDAWHFKYRPRVMLFELSLKPSS